MTVFFRRWPKLAEELARDLRAGKTVQVRPEGNSMEPRICSGQLVTLAPAEEVKANDIVLVKIKGRWFIHLVKGLELGGRVLIGNNKGGTNGWAYRSAVAGVVVGVAP